MPEISRFHGIVIRMYLDDHPPSHFHAHYAGHESQIAIQQPHLLNGMLRPRTLALVIEWARLHQEELLEKWHRLRHGRPARRIAPLE